MKTLIRVFATILFVVFWAGFAIHVYSADITSWVSQNQFLPSLNRGWTEFPAIAPLLEANRWWALGGLSTGLFIGIWIDGPARRPRAERARVKPKLALDYEKGPPPKLSIKQILYNQTDFTEMYVDFVVVNPGPPTVLIDWKLDLKHLEGVPAAHLVPKTMTTDRIVMTASGHIAADTMSDEPLETGGRRLGRMTFAIGGQPDKQRLDTRGTEFVLRARDMRGNDVMASHIVG